MFRRRRHREAEPAPPQPAWRPRVDAAVRVVTQHVSATWIHERLGELEAALTAAEDDHRRLTDAIVQLDPERATRELQQALRDRERNDPGNRPDDALVTSLQQRHLTLQQLQNRRDDLRTQIDTTVADLELLAARAVEVSLTAAGDERGLADDLQTLHDDLTALDRAHTELRGL